MSVRYWTHIGLSAPYSLRALFKARSRCARAISRYRACRSGAIFMMLLLLSVVNFACVRVVVNYSDGDENAKGETAADARGIRRKAR